MKLARPFIVVCTTVIVFLLLWYSFAWLRDETSSDLYKTSLDMERVRGRLPTILLATLWFNQHWFPLTNEPVSCPPTHAASNLTVTCSFTRDMSLFKVSDAVVFHARDDVKSALKKLSHLQRPANQRWVMLAAESPLNVPQNSLRYLDRYGPVNWTATYMKDSDVPSPYYYVVPGVYHGGFDRTRNYLAGRTGMATILVSNCWAPGRMKWIMKIKQYIDVQVYGLCGFNFCHRSCMSKLKKYKFYLSFENSYCHDYITEKIGTNAFGNDIIPVVIADVDFTDTSVIPPGSAISALDFPSVKELTDYMKRVGSNSTLYNEYFKWHSHYTIFAYSGGRKLILCPLCRQIVTNHEKSKKTYKGVHDWYSSKKLCRKYPVPV